jgi:malonyl-CoA/methylmalonyl-CoA synthetase
MIDIYLACVKSGILFVPINILYRDREISHILRDAEPRAVISDEPIAIHIPGTTHTAASSLEREALCV